MAVFTHISEAQLTQHLSQFDIGTLVSFTGIAAGVQNTNYKLVTTNGNFVLTLFERRVRAEDLPFFAALMKHLHGAGIPCPDAIGGGKETALLAGKPALITSFLEGACPPHVEDFHVAAVGRTLARIHLAGTAFPLRRDNGLSLPAWKSLIAACADKTDLLPFLQAELAYLDKNWPQGLPAGAVHADLFPDNALFTGETLTGVIDFYDACTDVFAYDLMMSLNAWCFENAVLNGRKAQRFMDAYQKERPLTAAEKKSLAFFGRAAAMRIVSTRLYDRLHPAPGAIVTPRNPLEFVQILKFHQTEKVAA